MSELSTKNTDGSILMRENEENKDKENEENQTD